MPSDTADDVVEVAISGPGQSSVEPFICWLFLRSRSTEYRVMLAVIDRGRFTRESLFSLIEPSATNTLP